MQFLMHKNRILCTCTCILRYREKMFKLEKENEILCRRVANSEASVAPPPPSSPPPPSPPPPPPPIQTELQKVSDTVHVQYILIHTYMYYIVLLCTCTQCMYWCRSLCSNFKLKLCTDYTYVCRYNYYMYSSMSACCIWYCPYIHGTVLTCWLVLAVIILNGEFSHNH